MNRESFPANLEFHLRRSIIMDEEKKNEGEQRGENEEKRWEF